MTHAAHKLATFLVDPSQRPLPPARLLRRAQLAAYACTQAAPDEPARTELLPDLLASATAHASAIAMVGPLIAAWRGAGIPTLALKGLALALDAYDDGAQRFYDDVDLLVPPEQGARAERIASDLGWTVRWSAARSGNAYSHELMHLVSPDRRLLVDVHRSIVHSYAPWQGLPRRITDAAWRAAREIPLASTKIHILDPRDAILIGVVLNRAWSTDDWRLKPRDYLDIQMVARRNGVTKASLVRRARELSCTGTVRRIFDRCDPFEGHLDLTPPTRRQRLLWTVGVAHERRPHQLDQALNLVLLAPGVLRDVAQQLPGVMRAVRLLNNEPDVIRLLRDITPKGTSGPCRADERSRFLVVRGVRWSLRLLRVRPEGDCLPRALAVYAALRRLGCPAVFVSGVRRDGTDLRGHAWVELYGKVLPELDAPVGVRYTPNLRYP